MTTIQQSSAAVEAVHKGYIAVAGPYAVNNQFPKVAKAYKAECVRNWRKQKEICPKARMVMHGSQAWIIRKKPMIVEAATKMVTFTSGKLGIKGGRAFTENKERVRL